MKTNVAHSDLASCGTRLIRAKLFRRVHRLCCVGLHKHIMPRTVLFFNPSPQFHRLVGSYPRFYYYILEPMFKIFTQVCHFFLWLIMFILELYWRFLWLIISLLVISIIAGIIANYFYTYATTCTPNKPSTCNTYFTDPSKWPIMHLFLANLAQISVGVGLFIIITICAILVHYRLEAIRKIEKERVGKVRLTLVRDLLPRSLNLGDDFAATFPYVVRPIQSIYEETIKALRGANAKNMETKRGILIVGESNSGKTRLAFETMKRTLPNWPVLRRAPSYTMDHALTLDAINSKHLIIFIDDLQEYVSIQDPAQIANNLYVVTLRSMLENMLQHMQRVVIVATCRIEDKSTVQAVLNLLFVQLEVITIPTFSSDIQNPLAKEIISEFRKKGKEKIEERYWDGTLGSLVLGLSTKNSQYLNLANSYPLSTVVLKAMKLLNIATIGEHTKRRVQAVCAGVFGKEDLLKQDQWRESVDRLTSLQFITVEDNGGKLVIRKDIYFAKVVTNYPLDNQPDQIEQDFEILGRVLAELEDSTALNDLSRALRLRKRLEEARIICDQALSLDSRNIDIWNNKVTILLLLNRHDEALAANEQALIHAPNNSTLYAHKAILLMLL